METSRRPFAAVSEIGGRSRSWSLDESTATIGRAETCQIALSDPMVSREHARLVARDDGWWVEDLGSTNGTLVNGFPVEERRLTSGDRIRVGATELEMRIRESRTGGEEDASRFVPARESELSPRGRRVFVSYARVDARLVDRLVRGLERRGHQIWIDREDIRGGEPWAASIVDAISGSHLALLILTAASARSPEVLKEVSLAASHRVPIVPVVVPPVQIPKEIEYHIAGRQQVHVDPDNPAAAVRPVVQAVEASETRGERKRRRYLVSFGIAAMVVGVLALGISTAATGRFPPWAAAPRCSSVSLNFGGASPATFVDLAGAVADLRFTNRSSREVSIPSYRDVVIIGEDGSQYRVEPGLARNSDWFVGTTVAPKAIRELPLPIARRGRTQDLLTIKVPGVHESPVPFLRCDLILRDVPIPFAG